MPDSPYLRPIFERIPEVLSLIDRELCSPTFGCADRVYWCWKFTDFPGARFQECLYTVAWLHHTETFSNPWTGNLELRRIAEAGLTFWSRIQYADGSFDEAYPFERSLAATAFTSFYLSEAFLYLRPVLSAQAQQRFLQTLERACAWLCRNEEHHGMLSNHLAAAAAALEHGARLLGERRFSARRDYFLKRIFSRQSREGWFEEYGGADPGYQTHGSFYLARLWELTKDERLLNSLRKGNEFLRFFVHPDGTVGGEYASRNTAFYFPAAFEMLRGVSQAGAGIANAQRSRVERGETVGLRQMDVQNLFVMLNNYIFAHEAYVHPEADKLETAPTAWQEEGKWTFSDAGLRVQSTSKYFAILALRKGGVLRVWKKGSGHLVYQSAGYILRLPAGLASSQTQGKGCYSGEGDEIVIETPFSFLNQKVFTPHLFVGFRIFNILFGRLPLFCTLLKTCIVKVLVERRRTLPARLKRKVTFEENRILVRDQYEGSPLPVEHLDKFTPYHMGSSRYAHLEEEITRGSAYNPAELKSNSQGVRENVVLDFI